MKLHITRAARADLRGLFLYIADDRPKAAQAVVDRILTAVEQLPERPMLGHTGRDPTTRELVVRQTSHIAVYRIDGDKIVVLRILHGAQHRDPGDP